MKGFAAGLLCSDGNVANAAWQATIARVQRSRASGTPPSMVVESRFVASHWSDGESLRPVIARLDGLVAVGEARLANRITVSRLAGQPTDGSDLSLVLSAFARHGPSIFARLHGEFALIVWDGPNERVLAARDAFGIKRLFWTARGGTTIFASSLDALQTNEQVNGAFIWSYLTSQAHDPTRTIWSGIEAIAPASYLVVTTTCRTIVAYWSPGQNTPPVPKDERDQCEQFAVHLENAVQSCIPPSGSVWCELSGGVDSSTVVCVAEKLHKDGLIKPRVAGTYSFVDDMPGADESPFLNAVLTSRSIRSEQISNSYPWQDDGELPPLTEEPRGYYPYWARDRRAERIVREAGGAVILSGARSDYYLTGSPRFLADYVAHLRLLSAGFEAHRVATAARSSLWQVLKQYILHPLFGNARRFSANADLMTPPWITKDFASSVDLSSPRTPSNENPTTASSFFCSDAIHSLNAASSMHELPLTTPVIDKRYPFFYRPLVDFALALPPNMLFREGTTKWILREATRDIVPAIVRRRVTKGCIDGRFCWALSYCTPLLSNLLRDPLVAQYGWVDAQELRHAADLARAGALSGLGALLQALSLETWLVARAGRWPTGT